MSNVVEFKCRVCGERQQTPVFADAMLSTIIGRSSDTTEDVLKWMLSYASIEGFTMADALMLPTRYNAKLVDAHKKIMKKDPGSW